MSLQDQFRQYLEAVDVEGVRGLWAHVFPNMPQAPVRDSDVVVQIHMARTQMVSIDFRKRAWSHRFLVDNGYPSLLPDELKPRAEQMRPRIEEAVGISVMASNPLLKPVAASIQKAMSDAVMDAHADGRISDTAFVTQRMNEARDRQRRYFSELLEDTKRKQ